MSQRTAPLLPITGEMLTQFGDRLRLARLRRRLAAKQVAERAGMSPMTLRSLERGGSGVTMGAYLAVMQVLGIEKDLKLLGMADPVGRELQDAQLPAHTKASRPKLSPLVQRIAMSSLPVAGVTEELRRVLEASRTPIQNIPMSLVDAEDWIKQSGFSSSMALAGLIDPPAPQPNKVS